MDARELYEHFQGKTCKRFGNNHSKQTLKDAHKVKMRMKKILNERRAPMPEQHILANISVHHEHYGDTPQQHAERKNNS